jgi:hypothetical protein
MAFAGVGLGALVVEGAWQHLLTYVGPLGLVALFGLAALWLPYVEVSDGGVEIRNVLRTIRVPWPAIEDIDGRYGLRLTTTYGKVTAWAAPAPAGRQRLQGGDSDAAAVVRRRFDQLQALGHLDSRRLERGELDVTWHVWIIVVGAALVVVTVAALLD